MCVLSGDAKAHECLETKRFTSAESVPVHELFTPQNMGFLTARASGAALFRDSSNPVCAMATADCRRPSVAFLTTLDDNKGSVDSSAVDSLSTATSTTLHAAPGCSESGSNSNSRVDSLSRDSRRGRDVKSAEVDLIRYQPLPGSVKLASVMEKVLFRPTNRHG